MTTATSTPRLSLARFSSNARLSRETLAFSAEVVVDGKVVGTVLSEGSGGALLFRWISADGKRAAIDSLASDPAARRSEFSDEPRDDDSALEFAVFMLADDLQVRASAKRREKTTLVFQGDDGAIYEVRIRKGVALNVELAAIRAHIAREHKSPTFLNHADAIAKIEAARS